MTAQGSTAKTTYYDLMTVAAGRSAKADYLMRPSNRAARSTLSVIGLDMRLLIVEDEARIAELVKAGLARGICRDVVRQCLTHARRSLSPRMMLLSSICEYLTATGSTCCENCGPAAIRRLCWC
jgi:hypothetical protein